MTVKKFEEFCNESVEIRDREGYKTSVDDIVECLMDIFFDETNTEIYENAEDLDTCDWGDVISLIVYMSSGRIKERDLMSGPYSIHDVVEDFRTRYRMKYIDIVADEIKNLMDDDYDEDVYDDMDAEKVIHKRNLGGGGYEAEQDFINMVEETFVEEIRDRVNMSLGR